MSDEPLALRIKHSKGTMPVGLVVDSAEEAAEAKEIHAKRGKRGLVTVWIHKGGQDIRV